MPAFDEGGHMRGSDRLSLRFAPEGRKTRGARGVRAGDDQARGRRHWLVTLVCDIGERTRYYLLSFGELLEVLEPADVRAWLREQGEAVARRYAEDCP